MRAIIYARQSQDRNGEEAGVTRQLEDIHKLAKLRGWSIVAEPKPDNDLSAAGKRTRPAFEAVLAAIEAGEVDAVIAWDMSRLSRNRRDTLRLIEIGERHGVHLAFVRGSDMDLSTPAGRLAADILAGVARHEIDQKSDRQKRATQQAAEAGKRIGGRRPFGYRADGIKPHPKEAAALRKAYKAILDGESLAKVARRLNEAGLYTPQLTRAIRDEEGKVIGGRKPSPWTAQTIRPMLLNPRYAGLRAIGRKPEHGRKTWEIQGKAEWKGIVPETTWRAACAVIADPSRARPAREGMGLLTGVGECGVCADGTTIHRGAAPRGGAKTYRCRGSLGHFARRADPVDEFVSEVVIERLSRPDARDLLYDHDRPNVDALRTELTALNAHLVEIAELHAEGTYTAAQVRAGTNRTRAHINAVEARLTDAGRVNIVGPLLAGKDVRAAWSALDTDRQREVIAALMRVIVHPVGRGLRTAFDQNTFINHAPMTPAEEHLVATVEIIWRTET